MDEDKTRVEKNRGHAREVQHRAEELPTAGTHDTRAHTLQAVKYCRKRVSGLPEWHEV
jgi:hypothetical protein